MINYAKWFHAPPHEWKEREGVWSDMNTTHIAFCTNIHQSAARAKSHVKVSMLSMTLSSLVILLIAFIIDQC